MLNLEDYFSSREVVQSFQEAVLSKDRVNGLTHSFYRYPARFSPQFVSSAIEIFTNPGDVVFDPFMGGGTTIVESLIRGRHAIGCDINALSEFIANVKTTSLEKKDIAEVWNWLEEVLPRLNTRTQAQRASEDWLKYQRNANCQKTWRIRKIIEIAIHETQKLSKKRADFAKCILLNTAQWALDSRKDIPSLNKVREKLLNNFNEMSKGIDTYTQLLSEQRNEPNKLLINRSVVGLEGDRRLEAWSAPKLILTSPPYPGVHILYHRWQVMGRRETPAPYWIANKLDGAGESYYNFGRRQQPGLADYFENAKKTFSSIAKIANRKTIIVQMIAFSDPSWQLPEYLNAMEEAGLNEVHFSPVANSEDGRLWRSVPNRKWHAQQKGRTAGSQEVVLFHKLQS